MEQTKIDEIRSLRNQGLRITAIAKKLNINRNTVSYYTNDSFKQKILKSNMAWFMKLPLERRREYYKLRADYQRRYQSRLYHSDEMFRKGRIEWAKNYQKTKLKNLKGGYSK